MEETAFLALNVLLVVVNVRLFVVFAMSKKFLTHTQSIRIDTIMEM